MIKVYGSIICHECRDAIKSFSEAGVDSEFFDICTELLNLKKFLQIRDVNPVFDRVKADAGIGIPCIVLEDGTVTLNPEDVLNKLVLGEH
jgi:glutaredoxin-related protein